MFGAAVGILVTFFLVDLRTKEPNLSDDVAPSSKPTRRAAVSMDEQAKYDFLVEDCKRYFGQWDDCDPVPWAILRVVQAQNDFAGAIEQTIASGSDDQVFEEAVAERIKAITALQKAIEKDPRGP
jgi:hypothetical protein